MALSDVDDVATVVDAAGLDLERRAGREPVPRTRAQEQFFLNGMRRFVERDPEGAWVAVDDGTVVGMATAIRRGSFWGLSMLFVNPEHQSRGVGRLLIDAGLGTADGARTPGGPPLQ